MAHGKIECKGTPLFLKEKFGTGYKIRLSFDNPDMSHEVLEILQGKVASINIVEQTGNVVRYFSS